MGPYPKLATEAELFDAGFQLGVKLTEEDGHAVAFRLVADRQYAWGEPLTSDANKAWLGSLKMKEAE